MGTKEEEGFERPKLEPKGKSYRLAEDWHTDCKEVLAEKVTVPSGFVTDGASIPRFLWAICGSPMDVPRIYAALVHDWLYTAPAKEVNADSDVGLAECDRATADRIYRDYQIALGISRFKAYTEYYALRMFGGGHWQG